MFFSASGILFSLSFDELFSAIVILRKWECGMTETNPSVVIKHFKQSNKYDNEKAIAIVQRPLLRPFH